MIRSSVSTVEAQAAVVGEPTVELARTRDWDGVRPSQLIVAVHRPAIRPQPRTPWSHRLLAALPPIGLTAVVTAVLAWNIRGYPAAGDDEGTYLAQAWAVQHGLGLAPYTYWFDHPPLGWLQLAAMSWLPARVLPQDLSVAAGRLAILPVVVACLLLLYLFARRLGLARWAASLAVLAYGLSPISVALLRQVYLDHFAVMWILAAFVLALSPRKHLWHHMAAGLAAAVAVLSKETMVIAVPAVLVALWQNTARTPVRPWAVAGFISGFVLTGSFYPLYAALKGELIAGRGHVSLLGAWDFQLGRPGSGSVLMAGSPSNSLLHSWLYYDGILLIGGLLATVVALTVRALRAPAIAAGLLVAVTLRPGGYLPAMYVVQLLPFFALLLAGVVQRSVALAMARGAQWGRRGRIAAGALVAVLGLATAGVVGPRWYDGDRQALVANPNESYAAAAVYLRDKLPRGETTVVVDDVLWLDLVRDGFPREHVLWFYKVDLDPAIAARLRHGWADADYLVSTPTIRQVPDFLPTVGAMLRHSTVVATFGDGPNRIEIRQINKEEQ